MRTRWMLVYLGFLVLAAVGPVIAEEALFEFEQLRGIPTGGLMIRNIPGGGVPWTMAKGEAKLEADGTLKVEVEGLVVASSGVNPRTQFIATLSCLNADGTVNNLDTDPVPATPTGDATIEDVLTLPDICLAPIIFVSGISPLRWFAISGF